MLLKRTILGLTTGFLVLGTPGLARASNGLDIVVGTPVTISPASGSFAGSASATAECPAGEFLTGGGANVSAGNSNLKNYQLVSSLPLSTTSWWAFATNADPSAAGSITAYAICAKSHTLTVVTTP